MSNRKLAACSVCMLAALVCAACVVEGSVGHDQPNTDPLGMDASHEAAHSAIAPADAATPPTTTSPRPEATHEQQHGDAPAAPLDSHGDASGVDVPSSDGPLEAGGHPVAAPDASASHTPTAPAPDAGPHTTDAASQHPECQPGAPTACFECLAASCCETLITCHDSEECWCLETCVRDGADLAACEGHCAVSAGSDYQALNACLTDHCADACH